MAHPLGPDDEERKKNQANALAWFAWLHDAFPSLAFSANWVLLSMGWSEEPAHRARMLQIDMVHVDACDFIFFVGGSISPGMIEEKNRAAARGLHQVDLTFLGYESPKAPVLGFLGCMVSQLNHALSRIPSPGTTREPQRRGM
jgi:hypothetical protein